MKKGFSKSFLAVFLIICLIFGQVPFTFAEEAGTGNIPNNGDLQTGEGEQPTPVPPTLNVTAPTQVNYESPITITAELEGASSANITFFENDIFPQKKYAMKKVDDKTFTYTIPANFVWSDSLSYQVEVVSGLDVQYYPSKTTYSNIAVTPQVSIHAPDLLITELVANGKTIGGVDSFEFIEIYNNSNQTVNLKDYALTYHYPKKDNSKPIKWDFTKDFMINAGETKVVFLPKKGSTVNNTVSDFNNYYGVSLSTNDVYILPIGGLANTAERTMAIESDTGKTVTSVVYNAGGKKEVYDDRALQYRYQNKIEMKKVRNSLKQTPGVVLKGQVPAAVNDNPQDYISPTITHKAVEQYTNKQQTIDFSAEVGDNIGIYNVKLYVSTNNKDFKSYVMTKEGSTNTYKGSIKVSEITSNHFLYYLAAEDFSGNIAKTDTFEVIETKDDIAYQNISPLFITEVTPDTDNVNGIDAYEFVEVYNNSTETISMNDYALRYRTPMDGPQGDVILKPEQKNISIPSGGTIVYWIVNDENAHLTGQDFNNFYKTSLQEGVNLIKVYGTGISNTAHKGLVIATNSGMTISDVYYNDLVGVSDVEVNKGIQYYYPEPSTTLGTKRGGTKQAATPGKVIDVQVPAKKVTIAEDKVAPEIEDLTTTTDIIKEEQVEISAKVTDNLSVKTVKLFYKSSLDNSYREEILQYNSKTLNYEYTIYMPEYLGSENIQYYFEASDGKNVTKSDVAKIFVQNNKTKEPLRIQSDYILKGTEDIKATSENKSDIPTISIDNVPATNTFTTLEHEAYFAFEVNNTNLFFKNAVAIGTDVLRYLDDTILQYQTVTVPIQTNKIKKGEPLSIAIRAGSKTSPFDTNKEENKDDFFIKNVRLVFEDGTVVYDKNYNSKTKQYAIGDGAKSKEVMNFSFDVPSRYYTSVAYKWNTLNVADGIHKIKATNSKTSIEKEVVVDNTAPIITTNMQNKTYKGQFTIEATALDALEGKKTITATLDNKPITLPFKASSAELKSGKHTLILQAQDDAENIVTKKIIFKTVEEAPVKPKKVSPGDTVVLKKNEAKLKVKVSDPTGDRQDVSFYQGYSYLPNETSNMKVYQNASVTEPPKTLVTKGEKALTKDQLEKISKDDNETITNTSTEKFPYYRFQVKLNSKVKSTDDVRLYWKGSSLPGRKVSMYAWNYKHKEWDLVDYKVANKSEFALEAYVKPKDYSSKGTINVIVQDEIAKKQEKDYEYSFAWISDTQYYSKAYTHIQDKMTDWVVKNKNKYNIQYVFHTGDLVDNADQDFQWKNSDKAFKAFDKNNIPYGVLAGNHDIGHKDGNYQAYSKYYGEKRFANKDYYGGSYQNNRGHYDLISANGNDYIMIYQGFGLGDEEIQWMNEVLAKYPDRKAILNFHEYLLVSGKRSPIGEKIYQKVVVPNKNVEAVLCGHYHDSELLVDEIDDDNDGKTDRTVYQILADYQGGPEGGQGYLRLLLVDQDTNTIDVKTYSPYLDEYNYYKPEIFPGKDEFSISMDLQPKEKVVTTNAFEVSVYTKTLLGTKKSVKSGSTAEIVWKNLKANQKYSWYTNVKDEYEGENYSDVWSFKTKPYKK